MTNEIYEDIPQRIANIYNSCSAQEQSILRDILTELSETGESKTYNDVWLTDFKEIPVSIGEFLCSPQYLGETNRQGDSVYPFWKHTMADIFSAGNKYNEIILSGATRIGKTSTAVSMLCYMLYLLMLYREPHEYFHKKEISKFSIVFANLTKDLAAGIAFREFQDTLKLSPWFNEHGTFTRSDRNFYYVPEGNDIEIISVSDAAQALGRQVWACVIGDTQIITSDGTHSIKDLADKHITVKQYDFENNQVLYVPADVILTKYVTDTIRITLEDGTVIEGTPDHRIMLSDGTYTQLKDLTVGDDIMSADVHNKLDISSDTRDELVEFLGYDCVTLRKWRYVKNTNNLYVVSNDGEYVVRLSVSGTSDSRLLSPHICSKCFDKYGYYQVSIKFTNKKMNYKIHRLVCESFNENPDNKPQVNHIDGCKTNNNAENLEWCTPLENVRHFRTADCFECARIVHRQRQSESHRGQTHVVTDEWRHKMSILNRRENLSSERRQKISDGLRGRKLSTESRQKIGNAAKVNSLGRVFLNDGHNEIRVRSDEVGTYVNLGWKPGRLDRLWVYTEGTTKYILKDELDDYLSKGYKVGRGKKYAGKQD